jgi:APA family basic amino acid/polyamine antiporter
VLAGLVPAFFSYGGWQHALWISGEVRDPRRNLPIGIVGGVVIVVIVYLLANWAYLKLLGHAGVAQSGALAADAVSAAWPNVGRRAVAAAVGVSALGVLNAQLLSGPRLIQRMADDGRFFRVFALVSGRFGTPAPAILLLGCMALVLLLGAGEKGVDRLLTGVVFIDGVFFVLTGAALFILRHRDADPATRTSAFAYPVAPVLFVLGELGVLVGAYADPTVRDAAYIGAAWIAAAIVLYLSAFRRARSAVDAGSDFA